MRLPTKLLITSRINLNKYQSSITNNRPMFIRDTKLTGFAIKVNPSGSHKYIAEFKRSGKSKRITIADVSLMSATEAREEAKSILSDAQTYIDIPVKQPSDSLTVSTLLDEYIQIKKKTNQISFRSISNYQTTLGYFHNKNTKLCSITKAQIMKWYKAGHNRPTQTDLIYRQLKAIFNFAVQMDYLESNPFNLPSTIRYKPNKKSGYLEPVKELPKFWRELCSRPDTNTTRIIKFYVLTGMRKSEIYNSALNPDGTMITIPLTKNKTDHNIPVIPLMHTSGAIKLFNTELDTWTMDVRKTLKSICIAAAVPVITIHDIRRTVSSLCDYLEIELGQIKALLNHSVSGDITLNHYIQRRTDYLLPVLQKIEKYFNGIT